LFYNFDEDEVLIRKCKLFSSEKDIAPIYPDDPGTRHTPPKFPPLCFISGIDRVAIERVCEISADLTGIPRSEMTKKVADNGKVYFKIIYAIALTFRSAIKFELVFNGKVYQTVTAKY
jgi:hypothetical protein